MPCEGWVEQRQALRWKSNSEQWWASDKFLPSIAYRNVCSQLTQIIYRLKERIEMQHVVSEAIHMHVVCPWIWLSYCSACINSLVVNSLVLNSLVLLIAVLFPIVWKYASQLVGKDAIFLVILLCCTRIWYVAINMTYTLLLMLLPFSFSGFFLQKHVPMLFSTFLLNILFVTLL